MYTGPGARPRAASGRAAACCARPASTAAPPAPPGDPTCDATRRSRVNGDNLYFFIHVRDDFQSYAVTPAECVAHWLADSVEILIDPRGNSSATNFDTGTTFKLGVFPFTNDPTNSNGNGVNGPCWERDADNHQGYSTGPLAATVDAAPNAPGVQVVSTATWVGSNETTRRPQLRRRRRLQPRGQDPAGRPAGGGRPDVDAAHRQRGDEHDRPAAHGRSTSRRTTRTTRPRRARRRCGTSTRARGSPGRTTPAASRPTRSAGATRTLPGLHAAGGSADDAGDAERLAPEPGRRRLAADDLPVGAGRRADLGPQAGARRATASRSSNVRARRASAADVRHHAPPGRAPPTSSSGPVTTGRSRCSSRAARSPTDPRDPGLRAQRRARRPTAASRRGRPT